MASPMLSKSSSSPQTNNIKGLDDAVTDDAASSRAGEHIFTDPSVANFWRDVYERSKYEGRHRFDPAYSWTEAEERKLVRKVRMG